MDSAPRCGVAGRRVKAGWYGRAHRPAGARNDEGIHGAPRPGRTHQRRRRRAGRRGVAGRATGLEPGGRPAARRRRVPGVRGRRRRHRPVRERSTDCGSRSTPAATTRGRSTGAATRSCSRPSAWTASPIDPERHARARRGGGALEAARGRRWPARARVPRRDLAERRRARVRARRRPQLADPHPRARLQHDRRGGGRDRRRPAGPRGPRDRARAVLGAPGRRRQRRRRDRHRARAVPDPGALRRGDALAHRAGVGGPAAPGAPGSTTVPEACESLGRMLQLPDVPFLPENVRGRSFVLVEVAITGDRDAAAALVAAVARARPRDRHRRRRCRRAS